jgi:hypothetical protein
MKPKSASKKHWDMNSEELASATAEFDKEFVIRRFRDPSATERARWDKARRKRGRPRVGKGAKVIAVSLEKGLLIQCDRLAKRKKTSRASLIARGLRAVIAAENGR